MHSVMTRAAAALLAVTLVAGQALAGPAEAWPRWTAKAKAISDIMEDGTPAGAEKKARMKAACQGVGGIVIGSGFQMPYFAQMLIGTCRFIDEAVGPDQEVSRGQWRGDCRNVDHVSSNLSKVKPIEGYPEVEPEARRLAANVAAFYDHACKHGLKRAKR